MGVSITAPLAGNKMAHRGPPASLGLPAFLLIFCVCPWLAESKSWKGGACADLSLSQEGRWFSRVHGHTLAQSAQTSLRLSHAQSSLIAPALSSSSIFILHPHNPSSRRPASTHPSDGRCLHTREMASRRILPPRTARPSTVAPQHTAAGRSRSRSVLGKPDSAQRSRLATPVEEPPDPTPPPPAKHEKPANARNEGETNIQVVLPFQCSLGKG